MKVCKKQLSYMLFLALTLVAIYSGPTKTVNATQVEGGAVQTNGIVSFYKEDKSNSIDSTATIPTNNSANSAKPIGRYPSTGERNQKHLIVLGLLLLLLVFLLFYFIKRKKQKKESN